MFNKAIIKETIFGAIIGGSYQIEITVLFENMSNYSTVETTFSVRDPRWTINNKGKMVYNHEEELVSEQNKYQVIDTKDTSGKNLTLTKIEKELLKDYAFSLLGDILINEREKVEGYMYEFFSRSPQEFKALPAERQDEILEYLF